MELADQVESVDRVFSKWWRLIFQTSPPDAAQVVGLSGYARDVHDVAEYARSATTKLLIPVDSFVAFDLGQIATRHVELRVKDGVPMYLQTRFVLFSTHRENVSLNSD